MVRHASKQLVSIAAFSPFSFRILDFRSDPSWPLLLSYSVWAKQVVVTRISAWCHVGHIGNEAAGSVCIDCIPCLNRYANLASLGHQ